MEDKTLHSIKELLQKHDEVQLAIVYGSASEDRQTPESDLDLAVAGEEELSADSIMSLIEELALIVKRPIDLVDLQTTHGPLLKQILSKGEVILKENTTLYGEIIKRMIFAEADFMPYYNRILKERREKWINS